MFPRWFLTTTRFLLRLLAPSPLVSRTDLSLRVDSVKEENLKLRSENQVLGQYIENLMSASNVFQSTSPSKSAAAAGKRGGK